MKKILIAAVMVIVLVSSCIIPVSAQSYTHPSLGYTFQVPVGFTAIDKTNVAQYESLLGTDPVTGDDSALFKGEYVQLNIRSYSSGWWDSNTIPDGELDAFISECNERLYGLSNGSGEMYTAKSGTRFYRFVEKDYLNSYDYFAVKNGMCYHISYYDDSGNNALNTVIDTFAVAEIPKPFSEEKFTYAGDGFFLDLPAGFITVEEGHVEEHAALLERWYITADSVNRDYERDYYSLFAHSYLKNQSIYVYSQYGSVPSLSDADQESLDDLKIDHDSFIVGLKYSILSSEYILDESGVPQYLRVVYGDDDLGSAQFVSYLFAENYLQYEIRGFNMEAANVDIFDDIIPSFTVDILAENDYDDYNYGDYDYGGSTMAYATGYLLGFIILFVVFALIAGGVIAIVIVATRKNRNQNPWQNYTGYPPAPPYGPGSQPPYGPGQTPPPYQGGNYPYPGYGTPPGQPYYPPQEPYYPPQEPYYPPQPDTPPQSYTPPAENQVVETPPAENPPADNQGENPQA